LNGSTNFLVRIQNIISTFRDFRILEYRLFWDFLPLVKFWSRVNKTLYNHQRYKYSWHKTNKIIYIFQIFQNFFIFSLFSYIFYHDSQGGGLSPVRPPPSYATGHRQRVSKANKKLFDFSFSLITKNLWGIL